ncbi:hypothetical protein P3W45_001689 [Vairimorpha bombi]|jgi:hypothetical protein
MYQPDINTYLEAIKQQYDLLLQDNKMLKQENKKLIDMNLEYKRKIAYYKNMYKSNNLIKMGSDWSVEGFKIFNIHQIRKFFFKEIYCSNISSDGRFIFFISNNIVHILENFNLFQVINDQIVLYEEYASKKYKTSYVNYDGSRSHVRYFLDDQDNLYTFQNNFLKKFNLKDKLITDTLNMPNHISMVVRSNLIHLTCYDKSFRIYDSDKLVLILTSTEEIKSNLILINNTGYSISSRNNLIIFDIQNKSIKITKIFNNDVYDINNRLYNIDNILVIRNNNNLLFYNTLGKDTDNNIIRDIEIEEDIKFINVLGKNIIVGNKESLILYDYKNNKKMYIKIKESEILNISNNEKNIVVEGNNLLRIFEIK